MKRYKVRASVEVVIEIPDDIDPVFHIEDNHCPGTGDVGAAIDAAIAHGGAYSVCWACNLAGKNEILGETDEALTVERFVVEDDNDKGDDPDGDSPDGCCKGDNPRGGK